MAKDRKWQQKDFTAMLQLCHLRWQISQPLKKKTWKTKQNCNSAKNKTLHNVANVILHHIIFKSFYLNSIDSETEQQSYLIQVLGIDLLVIISKDVVNSDTEYLFPACGL